MFIVGFVYTGRGLYSGEMTPGVANSQGEPFIYFYLGFRSAESF